MLKHHLLEKKVNIANANEKHVTISVLISAEFLKRVCTGSINIQSIFDFIVHNLVSNHAALITELRVSKINLTSIKIENGEFLRAAQRDDLNDDGDSKEFLNLQHFHIQLFTTRFTANLIFLIQIIQLLHIIRAIGLNHRSLPPI